MYVYSFQSGALVRENKSRLNDVGCYHLYRDNESSAQKTQLMLLLDSVNRQLTSKL